MVIGSIVLGPPMRARSGRGTRRDRPLLFPCSAAGSTVIVPVDGLVKISESRRKLFGFDVPEKNNRGPLIRAFRRRND